MQRARTTHLRDSLDRELSRAVRSIVEHDSGERVILPARRLAEDETAE